MCSPLGPGCLGKVPAGAVPPLWQGRLGRRHEPCQPWRLLLPRQRKTEPLEETAAWSDCMLEIGLPVLEKVPQESRPPTHLLQIQRQPEEPCRACTNAGPGCGFCPYPNPSPAHPVPPFCTHPSLANTLTAHVPTLQTPCLRTRAMFPGNGALTASCTSACNSRPCSSCGHFFHLPQ